MPTPDPTLILNECIPRNFQLHAILPPRADACHLKRKNPGMKPHRLPYNYFVFGLAGYNRSGFMISSVDSFLGNPMCACS